jgi:AmiR/NasT family two-component response regulator
VAWSTARTIGNLETAMETRQLIGTAVGLIMARQRVSETEAFDMLRRASQRLNVKLRLIAQRVVHPDASPISDS